VAIKRLIGSLRKELFEAEGPTAMNLYLASAESEAWLLAAQFPIQLVVDDSHRWRIQKCEGGSNDIVEAKKLGRGWQEVATFQWTATNFRQKRIKNHISEFIIK